MAGLKEMERKQEKFLQKVSVKDFMDYIFKLKKELYIEDQHIPNLCDKLYPRISGMTKREVITEIYGYLEEYKKINFPLNQLAKKKRDEFLNRR